MTDSNDDLIRARAQEIWEREGRPEGRHLTHWEQAKAEIENGIAASGGKGESIPLGLGVRDIPKKKEGPALVEEEEEEVDAPPLPRGRRRASRV